MSNQILSNQPPKGTADWAPEEFKVRQYIFNTWRRVCQSYGFEEYLTPILENAEIYRAKSGEDVGQKELLVFTDQGGRELAVRPEMTPSVTRLVSRIYDSVPKPIKYFSIANFMRNERPQRGRNREFWQLNCDIFGSASLGADLEILTLSLDLLLAFNPPTGSFVLSLNNRKLLDGLLEILKLEADLKLKTVRLLDKYLKMTAADFSQALAEIGLDKKAITQVISFMTAKDIKDLQKKLPALKDNEGLKELEQALNSLKALGYGAYVEFKPSVIRGFDYYDGLVFEVFDKHPDNNRALFGGGRYNGLAKLFGGRTFPAVGIAPGDETTKLFLESWGLLKEVKEADTGVIYLPILSLELIGKTQKLAQQLRQAGQAVELGLEVVKVGKALEYANKKGLTKVIIFGVEEAAENFYKIKNMKSGAEEKFELRD